MRLNYQQRQWCRRTNGGRQLSRVVCTATPRLASIPRRAKTKEELRDPAHIGASGSATSRFQILPGYESLQSYMLLPVEQYFVLDPKQIAHLGGNRFVLTVPRINLFNLWLEAVVEVSVTAHPASYGGSSPRVVLQAENCRISGSEAVESLRLDQRFALRFTTELTWSTGPADATPAAGSGAAAAAAGQGPASVAEAAQAGEIRASSQLDVWSEVVPPFHLLPREVLVGSCNGVLRGLVGSLLPVFVRMLAQDYQRWAVDPAYREERAARSKGRAA
ncbi:hypothetical protein GPECTOR_2g1143 [Gonium pectorale]|uniref:Uncharacterized protein n=1 Tax=Gonium pectorale TaxID=33097 RepID=A0A150H0R3_GONPE|nr:hypothetical protein GPECTOR_2g1143 [Gonium pectorale]|eukprot:KXZ55593.1 hypothetical protein GPECTOR_2g1143 [Gonium pectorale]